MKFYPAFLDLRGRPCLIIGGGPVAERKTLSLIEAGAKVTIVSPSLTPRLQELSASGTITHHAKNVNDHDLTGQFLVIAATDSPTVNSSVARACKKGNQLVNVAAPPEESTFIVPSVVDRGDLLIAVSTSGSSPALARKIRRELEERYGPEFGLFLDKFSAVRKQVLERVPEEAERQKVFQAIVDSGVIDLLRRGNLREAEILMSELADGKPLSGGVTE